MDKKMQLIVYAAAAYTWISMMVVVIESRKRKWCSPIEKIAMLQLMREIEWEMITSIIRYGK
jgi:hypothetical protein